MSREDHDSDIEFPSAEEEERPLTHTELHERIMKGVKVNMKRHTIPNRLLLTQCMDMYAHLSAHAETHF
ncbi:hypothetical protein XELAEV_18037884mg [Xenopus laevis]|uniref:Uncharacterized protein n=1 Tax=Xenopus laevis TaxID=8355 RepID=A0A974HAM3_XENLA|nr:hypothetical protein XELAEV_18037884mg [Xenopus laevis]